MGMAAASAAVPRDVVVCSFNKCKLSLNDDILYNCTSDNDDRLT